MNHPGIVAMKCAWADSKYYYLLFDYALNGDLLSYLKTNGRLLSPMVTYVSA